MVETHTHFAWICGHSSRQTHGVFARDDRLRNLVDRARQRIGVAIKQQPFTRAHPKNRGSASLESLLNDFRRAQIFVEEISPSRANVAVYEKNRAFDGRASACKIILGAVSDIDEICLDAARRRWRRPALGS